MIKYCKNTNFRIGLCSEDLDLERQRGTWKKKNVEFSCSEELPVPDPTVHFTLMRIRIRIRILTSKLRLKTLKKCSNIFHTKHFGLSSAI
jgi:hypothetical protein